MNWYKKAQYNSDEDLSTHQEVYDYYSEDLDETPPVNTSPVSPNINENIQGWVLSSVVQYPVYHGTSAKFDEFKLLPTKRYVLFSEFDVQSQGIFFSEDKETASEYGDIVLTCYINIKNPMLNPYEEPHMGINRFSEDKEARLAYVLRNAIDTDRTLETNYGINTIPIDKIKQDVLMRERMEKGRINQNDYSWIYNVISECGLDWNLLDKPGVVQSMRKMGYDGTFVCENNDGSGRSIFVMSPEQVRIVNREIIR